jgi:hypothetical protein
MPARSSASTPLHTCVAKFAGVQLQKTLEKHLNLTREAEEIAAGVVSSPSVEGIADDVCTSVTSLDMDDLKGRAGKHSWGYVEPAEAAQELLQESIAGHLDDMERRLDLGLDAAASVRRAAIFCRRMPTLLKSLSSGQDRKQPFKAKHHSDQTISSQAVHSQ